MKDFFHFTKSQRIGILTLIAFIIIGIATNVRFNFQQKSIMSDEGNAFAEEVRLFHQNLQSENKTFQPKTETEISYFVFDPNTLDSAGFLQLGLRPYLVKQIIKYRNAGGKFRKPNDLGKIYGFDEAQFQKLKPYILIPPPQRVGKTEFTKNKTPKTTGKARTERKIEIVEINAADTTQLKTLPCIGSYYAKKICAYRKKIGGFHSAEQLLEVSGMDEARLQKMLPHITVDASLIQKINVNKASVERLKAHPYCNFYTAKAIYDRRKELGKITSAADLSDMSDADDEILYKMLPYLAFE